MKTTPSKSRSHEIPNNVYMVYSKWTVSRIDTFLGKYGEVGFARVVYDNNGKETNHTIVVIDDSIYEQLCEEGFHVGNLAQNNAPTEDDVPKKRNFSKGLKISRFSVNENNYPADGFTKNLFIPVPKFITDDTEVIEEIGKKLDHLSQWNIVPDKSWNINVPVKSREKGGINGGCFVSFGPNVDLDHIVLVKILLNDTYWDNREDHEDEMFKIFWARDRKEQKSRNDVQIRKEPVKKQEPKSVPVQKPKGSPTKKWVPKSPEKKEMPQEQEEKLVKAKRPFPSKAETVVQVTKPVSTKRTKTPEEEPKKMTKATKPVFKKQAEKKEPRKEKEEIIITDMSQPLLEEDDM